MGTTRAATVLIKGLLIMSVLSVLSVQSSPAQEASGNDTWYVWMDTQVDNDQTRIVSDVFVINCCVKSPKYRKLVKRAEKWIKKNVDEKYTGADPLKKIQDEQLAREMMEKARSVSNVKPVNYSGSCQ